MKKVKETKVNRWLCVLPILVLFIMLLVIALLTQKQNGIYRSALYADMGIELYLDVSGEDCTVVAKSVAEDGSAIEEHMNGKIIIDNDKVTFTYKEETIKGSYDAANNSITLSGVVFTKE